MPLCHSVNCDDSYFVYFKRALTSFPTHKTASTFKSQTIIILQFLIVAQSSISIRTHTHYHALFSGWIKTWLLLMAIVDPILQWIYVRRGLPCPTNSNTAFDFTTLFWKCWWNAWFAASNGKWSMRIRRVQHAHR